MHAISEKQNEQIRTRSCSKRAGASVHPLVRREHQRMAIRFSKLCALLRRREEVPQMVARNVEWREHHSSLSHSWAVCTQRQWEEMRAKLGMHANAR